MLLFLLRAMRQVAQKRRYEVDVKDDNIKGTWLKQLAVACVDDEDTEAVWIRY